ncbi:MAG: hypothetical protein WCI05_07570 [Myxococcales bacterium]
MGKKRQRDRRLAQVVRAAGDPAALRALEEKSPETVATSLLRMLADTHLDDEARARVDSTAYATAKKLRKAGQFELALKLTAATKQRTPQLRREEALASLALGDDAHVAALIKGDPALTALFAPFLAALEGKPTPRKAPGLAGTAQAVLYLARAVAAVNKGQGAPAHKAIQSVPPKLAAQIGTEAIDAAVKFELSKRELPAELADVIADAVRSSRSASDAFAKLLGAKASAAVRSGLGAMLGLDPTAVALAQRYANMQTGELSLGQRVAEFGIQGFPEEQRGQAALAAGFFLLRRSPIEALSWFDRAVGLGADLGDALRGKLLAASHLGQDSEMYSRVGYTTGVHLANHLARTPAGAPLAFFAWLVASQCAIEAPQELDAIAKARHVAESFGGITPPFDSDLDSREATVLQHTDRARAKQLIEGVLQRDPRRADAWGVKAAIARAEGDQNAAEEAIREGARLTQSPALVHAASRMQRGPLTLKPGTAKAGELAAEFLLRFKDGLLPWKTGQQLLPDDFEACRAALGDAKLAFDAAVLSILTLDGDPDADPWSEHYLRARVLDPLALPQTRATLLAIAVRQCVKGLPKLLSDLAQMDPNPMPLVTACNEAIYENATLAKQMISALGLLLPRQEYAQLTKKLRNPRHVKPPSDRMVFDLDRVLAPDFSILDFEEDDDEYESYDDEYGSYDDDDGEEIEDSVVELAKALTQFSDPTLAKLAVMFGAIGLPTSALHKIPPNVCRSLAKDVEKLFNIGLTPATLPLAMSIFRVIANLDGAFAAALAKTLRSH